MNLRNIFKKNGGFSLIELVVVLVIIAIIAAITVPNLGWFISDANDEELIAQGNVVLVHLESMTVSLRKDDINDPEKGLIDFVKNKREDVLTEAGLLDKVDKDNFFITIHNQQLINFQYEIDGQFVYYNGAEVIVSKTQIIKESSGD